MQRDGIGLNPRERDLGGLWDLDAEDGDEIWDGLPEGEPCAVEEPARGGRVSDLQSLAGGDTLRRGGEWWRETDQKRAPQVTIDWTRDMSVSVAWLSSQRESSL